MDTPYSGTARDLFVINADGTHARRILRLPGGDSPNAWLPSGQIVFAHWPSDQARYPDWYSIRPDSTQLQALSWLRGAGDPLDWLRLADPGPAADRNDIDYEPCSSAMG